MNELEGQLFLDRPAIIKKLREAEEIVRSCKGVLGFQASTDLYSEQYWLRDLVYVIKPLLNLGHPASIKRQLKELFRFQTKYGELPVAIIRYLSQERTLRGFFLKALLRPKSLVFDLDHQLSRAYHSWVSDTGLLALIGLGSYLEHSRDFGLLESLGDGIAKLKEFNASLLDERALIRGTDWRDAMRIYRNKPLLCNQILLYRVCQYTGDKKLASLVRDNIELFWNGEFYQDFLGSDHFDSLGHSLGILWETFPKKRIAKIMKKFALVESPFGFKNIHPPYSKADCGQRPGLYQNSTVWPFVDSYAILAHLKVGLIERAKRAFLKKTALRGFNEYYDPVTGRPLGSDSFLMSAASYLMAFEGFEAIYKPFHIYSRYRKY